MFEVYFGKKDGLTWHARTSFFLSTYDLGVGLVRFISCEFLRIALVVFIERGTPWTLDVGAFARLSRNFRQPFAKFPYQIPENAKSWQTMTNGGHATKPSRTHMVTSRNLLGTSQRLFVSNSYLQGILPEPACNLPEHTLQLQFHSSIHEQTRQISHIFAFQLSRLSRSTFAFAIFREPAFSFRAGTPG